MSCPAVSSFTNSSTNWNAAAAAGRKKKIKMMSPSPTKTVARDLAASSTRAIVVHNARRGSPVLAALPGKLPVAIILFLLCVSASLRLEAAWISFSFTNYDGTPFSNAVVIIKPAGDPAVDAAGNVTAGNGFPTRIILSANGRATNWLQQQNYFVTNTFGGPNFLGKGYCFRAPLDSGPTVYPSLAPGLLI